MIHSAKQLHGYRVEALDGEIGQVKGFYFDDKDWVIRYLIVDAGTSLPNRKLLISPYALGDIFPSVKVLEVKLTREKLENSPSIEAQLPMARQHEREYYRYFNWPVYWGGPGCWGLNPVPLATSSYQSPPEATLTKHDAVDSHLRSTQEVTGYLIQGLDGEIGHVEDFLIEERNWAIRSLVVASSQWWSGKNLLVSPHSIDEVNWKDSKMFAHLSRSEVRHEAENAGDLSTAGGLKK
jgi:hypothetical protein